MKSYFNDFIKEERVWGDGTENSKPKRDVRQFSHHLLSNLTALFGVSDTYLETDLVFQNSFLPRSLALNFTSPLLSVFGGSAQVNIRECILYYLLYLMISCYYNIIPYIIILNMLF